MSDSHYDWRGTYLHITAGSAATPEARFVGQRVVGFDPTTGTITIQRASFWMRLRNWPRVFREHYRILRQHCGRLEALHAADTLSLRLLT